MILTFCRDGWMYGRIDGWVDGWKDEWNGWMEWMHGMDAWNTVITRKDGSR